MSLETYARSFNEVFAEKMSTARWDRLPKWVQAHITRVVGLLDDAYMDIEKLTGQVLEMTSLSQDLVDRVKAAEDRAEQAGAELAMERADNAGLRRNIKDLQRTVAYAKRLMYESDHPCVDGARLDGFHDGLVDARKS